MPIVKMSKSEEQRRNRHQAARALIGGGMVGAGVGVGTGVGHYGVNKEYYNTLTKRLKEGLTTGEKKVVSKLEGRGWLGRRFARNITPGTLKKNVPGWSAVSGEVAKGSRRLGRAAGIGSGALAALTILTLEKMKNTERKSKKASVEKATTSPPAPLIVSAAMASSTECRQPLTTEREREAIKTQSTNRPNW